MPATSIDRLAGITTSVAVKPPCVAVTNFPAVLSGLYTLGARTLEEGDRVLVNSQTDQTQNAIYNASSSNWTRALDFDGQRDVVNGTLVIVRNSSINGSLYEVVATDPIIIGSSPISFVLHDDPAITYPQIAAEGLAGVTPMNAAFPPMYLDRYAVNVTPGVTNMGAALQAAINVAKKNGGTIRIGPGPYLIDTPLDLTFPVGSQNASFGIIGDSRYKAATYTLGLNQTPTLILKHTGIAFDTTGSLGVHFENLSITTDSVTYPQICFLLARSTDGSSRTDRIINCYVSGLFHKTILYNYGAEDGMYSGCQLYNYAADTDSSVFDITSNNARSITSTFTTISSGTQSCIDHKIFGGEFANLFTGAGTNCDVFRFEAARFIKIYGPWVDCSAKNGSTPGRSLIRIDGTNSAQAGLLLSGILGEAAGAASSNYGVLVSDHARIHSSWVIEGCSFPNSTVMFGGGIGTTVSGLTWINNTNESIGGTIGFSGAFTNCLFDNSSGTVVAVSFDKFNNTFYGGSTLQANGEVDLHLRDYSQASGSQWKSIRNSNGSLVVSACDNAGGVTANNVQYNTDGTTQSLGKFYPVADTGIKQTTSSLYAGSGVPSNSNGSNGDFYLRGDTPGTANQRIYIKSAGSWVGIL